MNNLPNRINQTQIIRQQQKEAAELRLCKGWQQQWQTLTFSIHTQKMDLIKMEMPSIDCIAGKGSVADAKALIAFILVDLTDFFGIEWTEKQYIETTNTFYDEHHWASLPELKHFIMCVKAAKLGPVYGKLSPDKVFAFAKGYFDDLLDQRAAYHSGKRDERPENGDYVPQERVDALWSDWRAALEAEVARQKDEEKERLRKIREEQNQKIYEHAKANLTPAQRKKLGLE